MDNDATKRKYTGNFSFLWCEDSPLWNTTLTWNEYSAPDFTPCFYSTVAVWIPCAFLWFTAPIYILILRRELTNTGRTLLLKARVKMAILLVLVALTIYRIVTMATTKGIQDVMSQSLVLITMILAMWLTWYNHMKGQFTSGVLMCFWLLWFISATLRLYSAFLNENWNTALDSVVCVCLEFVLVSLKLVMSCLSDVNHKTRKLLKDTCPEYYSSFISIITYHWLTPLLKLGHKRPLERSDMWKLSPPDRYEQSSPGFEKDWEKIVYKWKMRIEEQKFDSNRFNSENVRSHGNIQESSETEPLIRRIVSDQKRQIRLTLLPSLLKHYGVLLVVAWTVMLCRLLLEFANPTLQKLIINFVESHGSTSSATEPVWHGYLYAFVFIATLTLKDLLRFVHYWTMSKLIVRVRSSFCSILFKKALTISPQARAETTMGEIVNLMSVDVNRIANSMWYTWTAWGTPLQVSIALYLLYKLLGASAFVSMAILAVMQPANYLLGKKEERLRTAVMKVKDERIRTITDMLSGIKAVKLYAWEKPFQERVNEIREKEIGLNRIINYVAAARSGIFTTVPVMMAASTFAVYAMMQKDHTLLPSEAFVALTLFDLIRVPVTVLMDTGLSRVIMGYVSLRRLAEHFQSPDIDSDSLNFDPVAVDSITICNGTFSWHSDSSADQTLRNINLSVKEGSLTTIVGPVGAGKSSLLSACVGTMKKTSGSVIIKDSLALASQQAWVQNATVRENILFGSPFVKAKYEKVLHACALTEDLKILANGDQTLIGEKGINLSGGQKQRVSLARAVYSDRAIYLLDDVLSAVDAHVGKHIFDHVIGPEGLLKDKTRLMVTHGVQWLPYSDQIVVLQDRTISECGTYTELLEKNGVFSTFLKTYSSADNGESSGEQDVNLKDTVRQLTVEKRTGERREEEDELTAEEEQTFDGVEESETGKVHLSTFKMYFDAMKFHIIGVLLGCTLLFVGSTVTSSIWLSQWTSDPVLRYNDSTSSQRESATIKYLTSYAAISILTGTFQFGICFTLAWAIYNGAKLLHETLLARVLGARVTFFDTKPIGMIVNRFSQDIDVVDTMIGWDYMSIVKGLFLTVGYCSGMIYSTTWLLALFPVVLLVLYIAQRPYMPTKRQLRRFMSATCSPIYTHFTETVNGAETIRAYGHQKRFHMKSCQLVDTNNAYNYADAMCDRWLNLRLTFLSAVAVTCTALICVVSVSIDSLKSHMNGSLAGLALSFVIIATNQLTNLLWFIGRGQAETVSIERIRQYCMIEQESDKSTHEEQREFSVNEGRIQFIDFYTRYRPELDFVLKGITLNIKAGEKVGVVGRTGAGKSSLLLALFRVLECSGGMILIDGRDISTVAHDILREKLTVLPQDPTMFAGSLRQNVDPFDQYSDDKLWQVLEQAHLKNYILAQPDGLDLQCGEGGCNLSVGQRQLVCLARALLRRTKVLVLDEATAAVDLETDDFIQRTIRTSFSDCTVLTIAHRINTIIDYDKVLVLDNGKIAEYGSPEVLLQDEDGVFYNLCSQINVGRTL